MSLEIISHRGYWKIQTEKNTIESFRRSLALGFGIETDIRDHNKKIVISHDPPSNNGITLEDLFSLYNEAGSHLMLALNIKADGLQSDILKCIEKYKIRNYFLFDMSTPDMLGLLSCGLNVFIRQSEYEKDEYLLKDAMGVWIDSFEYRWFDEKKIESYLERNKSVCLVSPELHGRDHSDYWSWLRSTSFVKSKDIKLCTDYPEEAKEFFNV